MARSTLTLEDYRYEAEDLLGLDHTSNDLDNGTILIASDKYVKFYRSLEVIKDTDYGKTTTTALSVTSTGYDLSSFSDIYDYTIGLEVYKDSVDPDNKLLPVQEGGVNIGYYIKGKTIYLNGATLPQDIIIIYQKSPTRISRSASLASITPDVDEDFENMLTLYIVYRYYARSGDNPRAAEDALNDSRNLTLENFNLKRKNVNPA